MSRSCYSDDYGGEFPGQMELFRANVERSLHGKAGQDRLREMRDALLAMPVKELHENVLVDGDKVCAIGAWCKHKGLDVPAEVDDHEMAELLKPFNWPRLVVLEAVYKNDSASDWRQKNYTPSMRYYDMLRWVNEQLAERR